MSLNALKPTTVDGDPSELTEDDFVSGADCNCPMACDETVYSQEWRY